MQATIYTCCLVTRYVKITQLRIRIDFLSTDEVNESKDIKTANAVVMLARNPTAVASIIRRWPCPTLTEPVRTSCLAATLINFLSLSSSSLFFPSVPLPLVSLLYRNESIEEQKKGLARNSHGNYTLNSRCYLRASGHSRPQPPFVLLYPPSLATRHVSRLNQGNYGAKRFKRRGPLARSHICRSDATMRLIRGWPGIKNL